MVLQEIPRFDDEAPSGPDDASGCESEILREGEVLRRSSKVTDPSEDDTPLVKVNWAIPHRKPELIQTFMTGALATIRMY